MENLGAFSDIAGHVAYAFLALSYILTNIFWLRVTAVISMFLEIVYFHFSGGNLFAGIAWTVLFIAINAFQLAVLLRDRWSLRLPEKEAPLLREALAGLDDAQISRLLKAADWMDGQPGDVLTRQDAPLDALYFLCSGRANVEVNRSLVTYLEKGSFVGEIAYLTGNPATATVVVDEPSRILKFSKMRMAKVIAADGQINGIIYQLLGRDLAMKMRRTNTRRILEEENEAILKA
jgi:CRP-like cAMP-binding protein